MEPFTDNVTVLMITISYKLQKIVIGFLNSEATGQDVDS